MKAWRSGGSQDLEDWVLGKKVTLLKEIAVGEILLQESLQFDAHNLVEITSINVERGICYGRFVEPTNINQLRQGANSDGFAIWDSFFDCVSQKHYKVTRASVLTEI